VLNPSKSYNRNLLIKNDILSTLAYFDIFTYPLKEREIWFFLPNHYNHAEFETGLQALVDGSLIFKLGEFYSLQNNYTIAQRRYKGNDKAQQLLVTAKKVAAFLAGFPFVKGVAVSGSLSKNFADETSDIDLFIITSRNRLWIARTFLHGFKKLTFLVNKQHLFCMNYFIEEDHLEIAEKNIFTATEIATLLPLEGNEAFENFYAANLWTKSFLPNKYLRVSTANKIKQPWIKWFTEKMLSNFMGSALDNMLMNITAKRWQRKTQAGKLNARGFIMEMAAGKYYAKPEAKNFQNKLIDLYERNVFELLHKKVIVMKSAN
jgi:predicted nucleotidyltransferase